MKNLHLKPDVVTLDYSLPDMQADSILDRIKDKYPNLPVLIISGQENISTAVDLLKKGAYDYIVKDEEARDRLWNTLRNLRDHLNLKEEVKELKRQVAQKLDNPKEIIGQSRSMQRIFELMHKAASSSIPVSISGETGTGKELLAQAIHSYSDRSDHPFVAVNLAAIPDGLLESELFGHEKGAFTGAINRRIGKFEEAGKGTIFLDEIGELKLELQAKLLRILQEGEFTRLGSNKVIETHCRIIVATHKDLSTEVREQRFREDVYYRLLGLPMQLPPLRERKEDIPLIAQKILEQQNSESLTFGSDALLKLIEHPYPGNVRELQAVIQLAAVLCDGTEICAADIRFHGVEKNEHILQSDLTLKEYTRRLIRSYLDRYDNNVLLVADKLDIGKSTIYRMIKEHRWQSIPYDILSMIHWYLKFAEVS